MKKIIACLLVFSMLFSISVSATDCPQNSKVNNEAVYEYFDDGSYMVTELECLGRESLNLNNSKGTDDYIVSGRKSVTYYDSDDDIVWQTTLTGSFLVVPSNSALSGDCQSATLTYQINSSLWHIYNIQEQVITNNACGFCTMKRKVLGITTKTVDVEIYITCDVYGNLT